MTALWYKNGWSKDGLHMETGTRYGPDGFNKAGKHMETGTRYGPDGFSKAGKHMETGTRYNPNGFDRHGFNKGGYDKEGYNPNGFDRHGFNKGGYDRDGFNRDGFDRDGYDEHGYDRKGYNLKGFHRNGFNRAGIHNVTKTVLDEFGFNSFGYFFWFGIFASKHNYRGFNQLGFHKKTGTRYNPNGFDRHGFSRYSKKSAVVKPGFSKDRIERQKFKGYWKIRKNGGYWEYEHRLVYESHYGKIPKDKNGKSFHIHHINGKKDDNRIQNLEAMSHSDHMRLHSEMNKKKTRVQRKKKSQAGRKRSVKYDEKGTFVWRTNRYGGRWKKYL